MLLAGRLLREGVLQQNALSPNDAVLAQPRRPGALLTPCWPQSTYATALIDDGITAAEIEEVDFSPLLRAAAETRPDDVQRIAARRDQMLSTLGSLR